MSTGPDRLAARKRRGAETTTIDAVTHDGRGIATIEGKKVFVPGVLPGETVRIERRKFRRAYDEAELLELVHASADRVEPRCAVFGVCGGCALQHLGMTEQLRLKEQALADVLERIGRVAPARWLAPLAAAEGGWRYRRRARLAVKNVPAKGRVLVGFRERRAPLVTDMHRCEVLAAPLDGLIDPLSELVSSLSIRSRVPQIEVAVADHTVELVFRVLDEPSAADECILRQFGQRHGLQISLQPGGLDSIRPLPSDAREPLYYDLPEFDLRMSFEPTDFVQVNATVNRMLVAAAVELMQLEESDRVLDLFCGIGNFSLPLARRAAAVLGIEGAEALTARARQNATANGIVNAEFRCHDLYGGQAMDAEKGQSWNKVLLDPPRSGAEEIVRGLAASGAERLVYVSCHPATLARDAAILARTGYRLEAAGIVDMFPHTAHAEVLAAFGR